MAETLENGHGVHVIDAMPPREMALACEAAGAAKAGRDAPALVVPGVLAGAFIAAAAAWWARCICLSISAAAPDLNGLRRLLP